MEFAGRFAGVGYSEVLIGITFFNLNGVVGSGHAMYLIILY